MLEPLAVTFPRILSQPSVDSAYQLQKHHAIREVFLTDAVDNNELECLDEIVPVCAPGSEHTYDGFLDVYVCEYEYDITWQV